MGKAAKKSAKTSKSGKSAASASQLDVVFDGTWVIVPNVDGNGKIIGVNVYSPACGHPQGVAFESGLNPNPWPTQSAFYQLDNHSHTLNIRRSNGTKPGMAASGIDTTVNHCVTTPRPVGDNWDLMISISIGPDAWVSSDTVDPHTTDSHGNAVACFVGDDAPAGKVSSLQTLSFLGVKSAALLGAPGNVQSLLPSPWSGQGTLIFEDEIPYIPSLQHERAAIFAMANLAGLDLAMNYPLPARPPAAGGKTGGKVTMHTGPTCGHSVIAIPS
jgi:hypothetical protein